MLEFMLLLFIFILAGMLALLMYKFYILHKKFTQYFNASIKLKELVDRKQEILSSNNFINKKLNSVDERYKTP